MLNSQSSRLARTVANSAPAMRLALHFRFIERGEFVSSTSVAVRLLARVLWAVRPHLRETGSLVIRMEKLFYTQDLGGELEAGWRRSIRSSRTWPRKAHENFGELDRIFVVVISGRLTDVAGAVCQRVERPSRHPFMFGLQVDKDSPYQQSIYLSRGFTPIGVLHVDGSLELAFSAIEYHPEIERMLQLMKTDAALSGAAVATARSLIAHGDGSLRG